MGMGLTIVPHRVGPILCPPGILIEADEVTLIIPVEELERPVLAFVGFEIPYTDFKRVDELTRRAGDQ
jgi:hypothetical protein